MGVAGMWGEVVAFVADGFVACGLCKLNFIARGAQLSLLSVTPSVSSLVTTQFNITMHRQLHSRTKRDLCTSHPYNFA